MDEELIPDAFEEAFDFPFGGSVADGGMPQDAANAGTDECDFLGTIDGTIIDEKLFGDAAFVEGGAECLNECINIFLEEELAVAEDAAGIVDEGDEFGLFFVSW